MAHVLMHLFSVERLAMERGTLPGELANALTEDLEYARFGAALPDLPQFARPERDLVRAALGLDPERAPFERLFHQVAPVAFGLKIAELVASGALVGREPGLAFLSG